MGDQCAKTRAVTIEWALDETGGELMTGIRYSGSGPFERGRDRQALD
jgi:hypothetical protein